MVVFGVDVKDWSLEHVLCFCLVFGAWFDVTNEFVVLVEVKPLNNMVELELEVE